MSNQATSFKKLIISHPTITSWVCWMITGICLFWWPSHVSFHADEGYIAEMSARVLRGEIPNIDFATNYWGLMYYINAFLFNVFGKHLLTLRLEMVFLISTLFLPCLYWILRNWMTPWWSILGTLFASALSICISISIHGNWLSVLLCLPAITLLLNIYPKSIQATNTSNSNTTSVITPSRTLIAIGTLLGLAFLMKHTIAVYTGFAVVQGLFYYHLYHTSPNTLASKKPTLTWLATWVVLQSLILFLLYFILSTQFSPGKFFFYFFSPLIISLFSVVTALKQHNHSLKTVLKSIGIIILSGLIPITLYLLPYAFRGQLGTLFTEILINYPKLYFKFASVDFIQHLKPSVVVAFASLLITIILFYKHRILMLLFSVITACIIGVQLFETPYPLVGLINRSFFTFIQWSLWGSIACVLFFLVNLVHHKYPLYISSKHSSSHWRTLTLLAWGSYMTMNLFPLGVLNYVGYSLLPFALITVIGLHSLTQSTTEHSQTWAQKLRYHLPVILFLSYWVGFGYSFTYHQIGLIDPGEALFPNQTFSKTMPTDQGGGIQIHSTLYNRLTPMLDFINAESKRNDDIFLFSDQPVIYFLSNHVNPTRYSYAIDSNLTDGSEVIKGLEEHQTTYVLWELNQFQYNQPMLRHYLSKNYKPYRELESHILVFKRRENQP